MSFQTTIHYAIGHLFGSSAKRRKGIGPEQFVPSLRQRQEIVGVFRIEVFINGRFWMIGDGRRNRRQGSVFFQGRETGNSYSISSSDVSDSHPSSRPVSGLHLSGSRNFLNVGAGSVDRDDV